MFRCPLQPINGCEACPENCVVCNSSTYCLSCNVGYYKDDTECKPCSGNCSRCTSDSKCGECIPGHYGYTCQQPCPQQCDTCENDTYCLKCKTGFSGKSCEAECSALCTNNCNKDNGECDGCIEAYYKEDGQCKQCSDGCASCQNKDTCKTCKDGYFLEQNTHDCNVCGLNCSTCADTDSCTECNQGYTNVNGSCLSCKNCNDYTTCISKNVCCQCIDGFWGSSCENKCNATCIRCGKPTGKCTECKDNTYGLYCDLKCSRRCVRNSCWQHNGTCTDGCLQGYTGPDCIDDSSPANSSRVALIVGPTSGALVLLVVVVIVLIILWRRNIRQTDSKVQRQEPVESRGHQADNAVLNPRLCTTDVSTPVSDGEPSRLYTSIDEANTDTGAPCDQDQFPNSPYPCVGSSSEWGSRFPRTLYPRHPGTLQGRGTVSPMATSDNQYESLRKNGEATNVYCPLNQTVVFVDSSEPPGSHTEGGVGASSEVDPVYWLPAGVYESLGTREKTSDTYTSIRADDTAIIPAIQRK